MKVLKQTESELIIGERGITTRHWGIFMFLLGGGGFTAITLTGEELSGIPLVMLIVAAILGLTAAIFMGKVLTHRLDRITGIVRLEYPARLNSKLEIEEFLISDIKSIATSKQSTLQQMLTNTTDRPGGGVAYSSSGFSYVLKDERIIESGIYSSVKEEITKITGVLSEFLQVPIE